MATILTESRHWRKAMSSSRIQLAAGACFLSAALGIALLPSVALAPDQRLANSITLVSMALFVFIILSFRDALLDRVAYRMPNWLVVGLLAGHLSLAGASVVDDLFRSLVPIAIGLVWTGSLLTAVSLVAFGIVVWRLRAELSWIGSLLAGLLVIEGLLFATIVFMANAILLSAVTDLLLGWVLLRLARGGPVDAARGLAASPS